MCSDEQNANWYLFSRQSRVPIPNKFEKPNLSSISEAYAAQSLVLDKLGWVVGGWKLGGTNRWTRSQFETSDVYFGPIQETKIFDIANNATEKIKLPYRMAGEPEIAVRLNQNVENLRPLTTLSDVYHYIECIASSVEFPTQGAMQDGYSNVCDLIADLCGSGYLVIGRSLPAETLKSITHSDVVVKQNGKVVQQGCVTEIIGSVPQALFNFFNLTFDLGIRLVAKQWVATGGCAPCSTLEDRTCLLASIEGLPSLGFSYELA